MQATVSRHNRLSRNGLSMCCCTLSLSNASLTGFEGRAAGVEGAEGGVSAIV